MKIEKGSRINMRTTVISPWKIIICRSTIINEYAILDGRVGLLIGNNCSISSRAAIYTASHDALSNSFDGYKKPVEIEEGVWICYNSVILPGVKIHKNCVLGANLVANRDMDSGVISMAAL